MPKAGIIMMGGGTQWIDKVNGKVINLNNFAYAGMSGWGGYGCDFLDKWDILNSKNYQKDLVTVSSEKLLLKGILTNGHNACGISIRNSNIPEEGIKIKLKVTGVKEGQIVRARNEAANPIEQTLLEGKDGIIDVTYYKKQDVGSIYIYMRTDLDSGTGNPDVDITIEQLPLYPGALVSDGIDDYGVTQEAINEEVGTMLVYGKFTDESSSINSFILNTLEENNGRLFLWLPNTGKYSIGYPYSSDAGTSPFVLTREPLVPQAPMYLATSNGLNYFGACFIQRIILIQEQLDDTQIEFLKQKVEMEYREWCEENGYDYAKSQLIE